MNARHLAIAALGAAALLLSSCVYHAVGYGYYSRTAAYCANQAWVASSYDASGFPIFGYSYGRPIYGYTVTGAAVYSFAALTPRCYVPYWQPARWYVGHWHYPRYIVRVSAPPQYPQGHQPAMRPQDDSPRPVNPNK